MMTLPIQGVNSRLSEPGTIRETGRSAGPYSPPEAL